MFVGNQLPVDDPRKEIVYQNFSRNLQDIVRAGWIPAQKFCSTLSR